MFNIRQSERNELQKQWNESGLRPHIIEQHSGEWFAVVRFRCTDATVMKPLGKSTAAAKSAISSYAAWCNGPSTRLRGV